MKKVIRLFFLVASIGVSAQTTIVSEDFDSGLPDGWSMDGSWEAGLASSFNSTYYVVPGDSPVLCLHDDADSTRQGGVVKTSTIDLSSHDSHTPVLMSFDGYFVDGDWDGVDERAYISLSGDGGNTWTKVLELPGAGLWANYAVDLSEYAGSSVMIAFHYDDGNKWNYGFAIDNFEVYVPVDQDVKLTLASYPTERILSVGQEIKFDFNITSYGTQDFSGFSFVYSIDGGVEQSVLATSTLSMGGFETFSLILEEGGTYSVTAHVTDENGNQVGETIETTLHVVPPVPNFTMTDTDGDSHDLHEVLERGDVVLLDFFASWCGPCEVSTPQINAVWEYFGSGSSGFQVFGMTNYFEDDNAVVNNLNWGADYPKFGYSETNRFLYNYLGALHQSNDGIPFFVMICPDVNNPGFSDVSWVSAGWDPEGGSQNQMASAVISCKPSLSIESESIDNDPVLLYPNPASDNATVQLNLSKSDDVVLEVVNTLGQQVFVQTSKMNTGSNTVQIPVEKLTRGMYYVNIRIADETITEKLNVMK